MCVCVCVCVCVCACVYVTKHARTERPFLFTEKKKTNYDKFLVRDARKRAEIRDGAHFVFSSRTSFDAKYAWSKAL